MKNILTVAMMALIFVFAGVGCDDEKCDSTAVEVTDAAVTTDPGSEESPDVPVEEDVALPEQGTQADTSDDSAAEVDTAPGGEEEEDSQAEETTEVDEDAAN